MHLSIYLSTYLFVYLSICLSIYLSIYPSGHPSIHLSALSGPSAFRASWRPPTLRQILPGEAAAPPLHLGTVVTSSTSRGLLFTQAGPLPGGLRHDSGAPWVLPFPSLPVFTFLFDTVLQGMSASGDEGTTTESTRGRRRRRLFFYTS